MATIEQLKEIVLENVPEEYRDRVVCDDDLDEDGDLYGEIHVDRNHTIHAWANDVRVKWFVLIGETRDEFCTWNTFSIVNEITKSRLTDYIKRLLNK